MKLFALVGVIFAATLDDTNPSYNLCRVFDPSEFERIIPDIGLGDAWLRNDGINPDYQDKGKIVTLSGLDMYVVGTGSTAIIWNYDVFGFDAGRTREYW